MINVLKREKPQNHGFDENDRTLWWDLVDSKRGDVRRERQAELLAQRTHVLLELARAVGRGSTSPADDEIAFCVRARGASGNVSLAQQPSML